MNRIDDKKEWKKMLSDILRECGFLNKNTENIQINCNNGAVTDVKPLLRYK